MKDSDRTLGSDRTFGAPDDAPTFVPAEDAPTLPPGTVLAGRYQIVDLLGIGGMGAVYKAFDRQLTRVVALKTILPEMAATPSALKRFKQEVLLAQSIVHKNVVRIFDIGEDGPTKFITMDFVEGADLKSLIVHRGKLPAVEAAGIIRQVCDGLEAAHAAGVVHRDLKPQNIMIEKDGHVVVMDFGIAHSGQSRGVTQTGAFLGTPEYMSPEQAQTENVDARSDIFSLGLIFFELLTGRLPFQGKTVLETMFIRTKERAIPPAEIDRTVPKGANDIVIKCLQMDRELRYQSVRELLDDLEVFDPSKKVGAADRAKARLRKVSRYRNWAAVAVLLILAVFGGYFSRRGVAPTPKPSAPRAPETVLIADFVNHTGDSVFDGTLEPVVKIALEGAQFITAYDRTQLRNLDVKPVSGRLDEVEARQIAVGHGVGVVVSGSLDREGNGYVLSVKATRVVTGNSIASAEDRASNKDQVLFTTAKLAAAVRKALGDDTSEAAQRFAMETLTATSLAAIHEYAAAMQALSNGKPEDALKSFSNAVGIDQSFGLAYAGMAIAARNQGKLQDAEGYMKLAFKYIDRMTEREQYRTRGAAYAIAGNSQKCVEDYGTLISRFPAETPARNNLAQCLTQVRQIPQAVEVLREAAKIFPRRPIYHYNISVYSSYAGDFATAEQEARTLNGLDTAYDGGLIATAFAQLGQGQLTQAAETYAALGKTTPLGGSKGASGLADLAIYEGRFQDAARILEQGAEADLTSKNPDRAATKLAWLAYTRLVQNQKKLAVEAAQKALENSKNPRVRFLAGRIFAAAGEMSRAQTLATGPEGLDKELQNEPRSYAKLIEGEIALQKKDPRAAVTAFTDANNLVDTWISRFDLGRAYLEEGALPEADGEFARCIQRRGEALSLFLDEWPTYGYLPQVYYYAGRVREAMKSDGFAQFYQTYLSMREKAGEDPLLADVRKRAGK